MTVKQLVTQLLEMPMDVDVDISYMDVDYDYASQEAFCVIKEDGKVRIVGYREVE